MTPTIIIGYDGSDRANDALALGRWLARAAAAEMILANVYPDRPVYLDLLRGDAERLLSSADTGEQVVGRALPALSTAEGLRDLAEETNAQMIVVGSTHRGKLGLIAPGSTGERLLHGAPCAVAVAPAGYATEASDRPKRVAVACDARDEAAVALDAAIGIARSLDAPLRVITVLEVVPQLPTLHGHDGEAEFFAAMRDESQACLNRAMATVPDDVEAEGVMLEGDAAQLLRAQDDVALLVLGTSGFGRLEGVFLGSVSARVVRGARAPVLIVPTNTNLSFPSPEGAEQWDANSSSDTTARPPHTMP